MRAVSHSLSLIKKMNPTFPERVEAPPKLAAQAYSHLRTLILGRHILGGTGLSEARLALELNVSRTPMREALVRLAGEGLLEKTTNNVYRVRSVSIPEFFECMEVREVLECYAVEKAIAVATDDELNMLLTELKGLPPSTADDLEHWQFDNRFHSFFASTANNQSLAQAIQKERVVARLFRISSSFHRQVESDEEHIAIIEAVIKRDVSSARKAMRFHLQNLQNDAKREIANQTFRRPLN